MLEPPELEPPELEPAELEPPELEPSDFEAPDAAEVLDDESADLSDFSAFDAATSALGADELFCGSRLSVR